MRRKAESWWDSHVMNEDRTSELGDHFVQKFFDLPKPSITLKPISYFVSDSSDIIPDISFRVFKIDNTNVKEVYYSAP